MEWLNDQVVVDTLGLNDNATRDFDLEIDTLGGQCVGAVARDCCELRLQIVGHLAREHLDRTRTVHTQRVTTVTLRRAYRQGHGIECLGQNKYVGHEFAGSADTRIVVTTCAGICIGC